MALNPLNSSDLEQLALKGFIVHSVQVVFVCAAWVRYIQ